MCAVAALFHFCRHYKYITRAVQLKLSAVAALFCVCFQAQHHPWLNSRDPSGKEQKLSKAALANLVAFRTTNVLKKLALELVARSLDHEQIRKLEKDFAKVGGWVEGRHFAVYTIAKFNLYRYTGSPAAFLTKQPYS